MREVVTHREGERKMKCKDCPFTLWCYSDKWGKRSVMKSNNDDTLEVLYCSHCGFTVCKYCKGTVVKKWLFDCERRQYTKKDVATALKYVERGDDSYLHDPLGGQLYLVRGCALCRVGDKHKNRSREYLMKHSHSELEWL